MGQNKGHCSCRFLEYLGYVASIPREKTSHHHQKTLHQRKNVVRGKTQLRQMNRTKHLSTYQ